MNPYRVVLLVLGVLGLVVGLLSFAAGSANFSLGVIAVSIGGTAFLFWLVVSAVTWSPDAPKRNPADNVH